MQKSLFESLQESLTLTNVAHLVVVLFFLMLLYSIYAYCGVDYLVITRKYGAKLINYIGGRINKLEERYHRDLLIGKLNLKSKRVKHYRFLNDLIIDLELKGRGCTPYEFLFILLTGTLLLSTGVACLIFNNAVLIPFVYPIVFIVLVCVLYTKGNVAHDRRIEATLQSENAVCNNIRHGVVVAVRNSIDLIPLDVRDAYKDFLDNVETKNVHIKTALLDLNNNLGSMTDDFIRKCIVLETEEEKGIVGMFADIVEVNNIKSEIRIHMKRKFEEVTFMIAILLGAIMLFLVLFIALYEILQNFYLRNPIGQMIILIDILILVLVYMYILKQRATTF